MKIFTARTATEALRNIRQEFGPDAVILQTRTLPATRGRRSSARVEITATRPARHTPTAASQPAGASTQPKPAARQPAREPKIVPNKVAVSSPPSGTARRADDSLQQARRTWAARLAQAQIGEALARTLVQETLRDGVCDPDAVRQRLVDVIAARIPSTPGIALKPGQVHRVALVGPPGSGKTSTIAKLAAHHGLVEKHAVSLLSLDAHRVGANDQIHRFSDLLGVPATIAHTLEAAQAAARGCTADLLLIDTAGVSPRDTGRLARLTALLRAVQPDEVHLVIPASAQPTVIQAAARTFRPLGVSRLILTRLDEALGLGVLLHALEELSWAISYTADGQDLPLNLQPGCSRRLASLVLSIA